MSSLSLIEFYRRTDSGHPETINERIQWESLTQVVRDRLGAIDFSRPRQSQSREGQHVLPGRLRQSLRYAEPHPISVAGFNFPQRRSHEISGCGFIVAILV